VLKNAIEDDVFVQKQNTLQHTMIFKEEIQRLIFPTAWRFLKKEFLWGKQDGH
jgi:hypothetical protein